MFHDVSKKMLVVEASSDCDYGDEYSECAPTASIRNVETAEELVREITDFPSLLIALLDNPTFLATLKHKGWINLKSARNQKEKLLLQEKFYITDCNVLTNNYSRISEIDLNELSSYDAGKLAKDSTLLQKVSPTSLKTLNPKAYKAYQEAKKKATAAKERSKKAAATRKIMKQEKEIAKAKKLLEDVGELKGEK